MNEHDDPNSYENNNLQLTMFGDNSVTEVGNWMKDPLTGKATPAPIAEYEPIYYWRVQEYGT